MAIELVTGFAGEPHIASEDVGAYNAATMGTGSYILSGCAVTMSSTTKMHIAAGELLIQGRHVRITGTGIDLAVANGTTGYNRIDLAAIHYSKASTGVETVAVEIVEGTPTTGTATAPSTSGGSILNGDSAAYITLAQVAITGLTVGTPTRKLSTFTSLASVQDSVSRKPKIVKYVSSEIALAANSHANVAIPMDIPLGYTYAGVAHWGCSEWNIVPSKIDVLGSATKVSVNLLNPTAKSYTTTFYASVLYLPA